MGTLPNTTSNTMVATQLLISLCAAGMAMAAPQFRDSAAAINQQGIVTNVVSALQPNIAAAVAEALRGLRASSISSNSATSSFGSTGGSSSAAGQTAAADLANATPASYNFQYQIADEEAQTYITQAEGRDGTEVTGTYSYVDPNGDLVTVKYNAGLDGYSETREKQVGAVQIRAKPVRPATTDVSSSSSTGGSRFGSRLGSSSTGGNRFGVQTQQRQVDQSALIAQILAALQPQISTAVNSAVANL